VGDTIGGDTVVSVTMKQLLIATGVLLTGLTALAGFTFSGMKDDIGFMRKNYETLAASERESALKIRESENRLIDQLGQLRVSIERLDGRFAGLDGKIDGLNKSIDSLTIRLNDTQKQLATRQVSIYDPKVAEAFIRRISLSLKTPEDRIVIVPIDPLSSAP
jgi:septal ring factor EnvC (AmiA/AmiB activator)